MKYKSTEGNIFSSENFDPDFIHYLYSLPVEFIEELFMSWAIVKNKEKNYGTIDITGEATFITKEGKRMKVEQIDIDAIHKPKAISTEEIKDFYKCSEVLKYKRKILRKIK
jgi:hypothetical protein